MGSSDSEREPKSAKSDPGRSSAQENKFPFMSSSSSKNLTGGLGFVKQVANVLDVTDNGSSVMKNVSDECSEALEAADVPLDGRIFMKCSVTSTNSKKDGYGDQFTDYCIQYDAIYLSDATDTGIGETKSTVSFDKFPDNSYDAHMVLHTNIVSRRFKEFVGLHNALASHPLLRHSLKGVQGPNKWRTLHVNKMDSVTISARKKLLEEYLQTLLLRLEINCSAIMRDFLAYSTDESVTFARKPLSMSSQRLSKVLGRTMSGVFRSLRPTLPIAEGEICNYSIEEPSIAKKVPKSFVHKDMSNKHLPVPSSNGKASKSPLSPNVSTRPSSPSERRPLYSEQYKEYDLHVAVTGEVQQSCAMEEALFQALQVGDDSSSFVISPSNQTSFDSCEIIKTPSYPGKKFGDVTADQQVDARKQLGKGLHDRTAKDVSKENTSNRSRFFVASNFVDDFLENAKRKVNVNLGVPISYPEPRRRSLPDDPNLVDHPDNRDKVRDTQQGNAKLQLKNDTAMKVETDGVDGIIKERLKGVYSKVKSSTLLSGSQNKNKDEKEGSLVSNKDIRLDLPDANRGCTSSPLIVYSNATSPSNTPGSGIISSNRLKQTNLKKMIKTPAVSCLRCYGSAVPPVNLPQIHRTGKYEHSSEKASKYGSALSQLVFVLLAHKSNQMTSQVQISDSFFCIINELVQPSLGKLAENLLDDAMDEVKVAKIIRSLRLKILDINFFHSMELKNTAVNNPPSTEVEDNSLNSENNLTNIAGNGDCFDNLENVLLSHLPADLVSQFFGKDMVNCICSCLKDAGFRKSLAMEMIKVIVSHSFPQGC